MIFKYGLERRDNFSEYLKRKREGELDVSIPEAEWEWFCIHRPCEDMEELEAEFVSGTGITENRKELWNEASERFMEYIHDLQNISRLDINAMARALLTEEESIMKKERTIINVIDDMQEKMRRGEIKPMTDEEIEADIQEYRREKALKEEEMRKNGQKVEKWYDKINNKICSCPEKNF